MAEKPVSRDFVDELVPRISKVRAALRSQQKRRGPFRLRQGFGGPPKREARRLVGSAKFRSNDRPNRARDVSTRALKRREIMAADERGRGRAHRSNIE